MSGGLDGEGAQLAAVTRDFAAVGGLVRALFQGGLRGVGRDNQNALFLKKACAMLRAKLSTVPALLLACGVAVLSGCSTTAKDETAGWSPNRIYSEAKDEASAGAYDKAVTLFEKLVFMQRHNR